jgi:hypothetical protein
VSYENKGVFQGSRALLPDLEFSVAGKGAGAPGIRSGRGRAARRL